MSNYIISGIQQIGIGVENLPQAWKYYIDVFNMDVRILEDDTVAELMLPYTETVRKNVMPLLPSICRVEEDLKFGNTHTGNQN